MSYTDVIKRIESLLHYKEFACSHCGHRQRAYTLLIQVHCEKCNTRLKIRGHASIGSEIEDVIDAVLSWLGQGREFELAMQRKQVIDSSSD